MKQHLQKMTTVIKPFSKWKTINKSIQNCNKHLPLYGKMESFRPQLERFYNTYWYIFP